MRFHPYRLPKMLHDSAKRALSGGEKPRKEPNSRRPEMWAYMRWALTNRPDAFTPAQAQALQLTYERGLSQRQAAEIAGCSRSAYRARLSSAEKVVRVVLWAEARVDGKRPSEVRRGRNEGRAQL